MSKTERICLRLTVDERERLKFLAKREGRTLSNMIMTLINRQYSVLKED